MFLVTSRQPSLVRHWWLSFPLNDAFQLWQLVLDQQNLLEYNLLLHHYHVRFAIKADLGNLLRAECLGHPSCYSPARMA